MKLKVEADDGLQTEGCWPMDDPLDTFRFSECSRMRVMTLVDRNHESGVK